MEFQDGWGLELHLLVFFCWGKGRVGGTAWVKRVSLGALGYKSNGSEFETLQITLMRSLLTHSSERGKLGIYGCTQPRAGDQKKVSS